jgi:Protein of unknown function (DUF2878)
MAAENAWRSARSIRPAAVAGVAVLGAGIGTAWDLLHVRTGTSSYAIGPDRVPLWVPLEFALVYVAGVVAIAALGSARADVRSPARLVREAVWVTGVYAMTALLHQHEWVVVMLAAAALVARRRALADVVRANPVPAVALVVAGPVVESILISANVFSYARASLGNFPIWLPLLYANAIPFAVRLAETALFVSRVSERQTA